jgi:hypothetical protein
MSKIITISCDNCAILKQETNHWWAIEANIDRKVMLIHPYLSGTVINAVDINFIEITACGEACLEVLESKIRNGVNPLKKVNE